MTDCSQYHPAHKYFIKNTISDSIAILHTQQTDLVNCKISVSYPSYRDICNILEYFVAMRPYLSLYQHASHCSMKIWHWNRIRQFVFILPKFQLKPMQLNVAYTKQQQHHHSQIGFQRDRWNFDVNESRSCQKTTRDIIQWIPVF